jgi:hypothetical protein
MQRNSKEFMGDIFISNPNNLTLRPPNPSLDSSLLLGRPWEWRLRRMPCLQYTLIVVCRIRLTQVSRGQAIAGICRNGNRLVICLFNCLLCRMGIELSRRNGEIKSARCKHRQYLSEFPSSISYFSVEIYLFVKSYQTKITSYARSITF